MAKSGAKLSSLYNLLSGVDKTYAGLPTRMRLAVEKISQGLSEMGPRKLGRRGSGTEFYEARDFREDVDDPRKIDARLSGRAGRNIVAEKEAEIRQHIYLWRDPQSSMDYKSTEDGYTKKEAAEIMMLAFAKHIAKNEDLVGILDQRGTYRSTTAAKSMAGKLTQVNVMTGGMSEMPVVTRKLPSNSTAVLFSDFFMDKKEILKGLDAIRGQNLKGYMVMVVDPEEIDFSSYKGHVKFNGMKGEGVKAFKKAEAVREEYHKNFRDHVKWLQEACKNKGFELIIQRTDQPLQQGLLAIYGDAPKIVKGSLKPK